MSSPAPFIREPDPDEPALVAALREGEAAAFLQLVDRHHAALVRVAASIVGDQAVAEEVAQETWLRVVRHLGQFEGRAAFKTWLFRILTNTALTAARREGRSVTFSELAADDDEPLEDPARFHPSGHPEGGHWAAPPQPWPASPVEAALEQEETLAAVRTAIAGLPANQRAVITLHDIEGYTTQEICNLLALTESNQRVLLHRARTKVRRALERHYARGRDQG